MAHDILIVDDEADIRMLIAGVLKDEGYGTREAANSTETMQELKARQPTLVILDIWLQDSELDGIEILRQLRSEMPSVPVVMISGHGTIEDTVKAIKLGAYEFIERPYKSDRWLLIVERAIEAEQLRGEKAELRLRAGGELDLVGASPAINQLRQQIERVAPTGSRVLITGAPGSGKEVVGRLLHARSRRAQGPFVAINCATMHPDRLEIELFGCEASNDGMPRKVGTFERAHGGTLFLDEVADMPLETQGKIVRALQEQTFERVGGSSRVEVDVRVVASSNRELAAEIAASRFREDLFYRLNVVPIRVPPLRERREDIPLLARHFVQRGAEAARIAARDFGEDALAAPVLHLAGMCGSCVTSRWRLIMAPRQSSFPRRASAERDHLDRAHNRQMAAARSYAADAAECFARIPDRAGDQFAGNISRTTAFVGWSFQRCTALVPLGVAITGAR